MEVRVAEAGRYILTSEDGKTIALTVEDYKERLAAKLIEEAPDLQAFRTRWVNPAQRKELMNHLPDAGRSPRVVRELEGHGEFDLYDVLAELGYGLAPKSRQQRADSFTYKNRRWLSSIPDPAATAVLALAGQFLPRRHRGTGEQHHIPNPSRQTSRRNGRPESPRLPRRSPPRNQAPALRRLSDAIVNGNAPLPPGWEWVRLDDVCEPKIEQHNPSAEPEAKFSYVEISGIDTERKAIVRSAEVLGKDAPSRARQRIRTGDVLVSTTRPNLNAVARVPDELDGQICSTGFCVLRPTEVLDGEFLFQWTQSPRFVGKLSALVNGALYPAVTDKQVRAQRIALPSLAEQRRISAKLSAAREIVIGSATAIDAQLGAVRALLAARTRVVFDQEGRQAWPCLPLGEVATIGTGITLGRKLDHQFTRRVPYLRVANVKDGYLDLSKSDPPTQPNLKSRSAVCSPVTSSSPKEETRISWAEAPIGVANSQSASTRITSSGSASLRSNSSRGSWPGR
ncbi:MAG TPA: restriction endonuclease subunit S [Chloroflexota bacterium]|nr:restriction endonuclease subunit S [Chloroflexota bacterium]